MNVSQLYKSFLYALRGVRYVFEHEQNFRIQTAVGAVAIGLSWVLLLATWERILVMLLVMAVLAMEILNTAVERMLDLLKPRLHSYAGVIKDIMAGAVLIVALGTAIIGFWLFLPHFITCLK